MALVLVVVSSVQMIVPTIVLEYCVTATREEPNMQQIVLNFLALTFILELDDLAGQQRGRRGDHLVETERPLRLRFSDRCRSGHVVQARGPEPHEQGRSVRAAVHEALSQGAVLPDPDADAGLRARLLELLCERTKDLLR